ncbi:accessory factor UbiK family protein [Formosimonas limnophila]|nr:accessory factor UbiK family protein [Formosimonas limnophila]
MMSQQWQSTVEQLMSNSPLKDLTDNVKTFLVGSLRNLDVVTREEFDVQAAMLARTREKLELLEKQVTALEVQLK